MENRAVTILERTETYKRAFFNFQLVKFQFTRFNGPLSPPVEHLVFNRGDSVAMLVHDVTADDIFLVEQVRIATIAAGDGWILELPAGRIDGDEAPEAAALRELQEEIGVQTVEVERIASVFPSPGACSERIHIFYCPVQGTTDVSPFGGLESEGEDIKVHRLSREIALERLKNAEFADAKTIIALQWMAANR